MAAVEEAVDELATGDPEQADLEKISWMTGAKYDEEFDARVAEVRKRQVFFVLGAGKSGTTWLQRMINRHPEAVCLGEGHFGNLLATEYTQSLKAYNHAVQTGVTPGVGRQLPPLGKHDMAFLLRQTVALQFSKADITPQTLALGDKTPENCVGCGVVEAAFPGSKYVHIVRDPRDQAVSFSFYRVRNARKNGHANPSEAFKAGVLQGAMAWKRNLTTACQFTDNHPGQVHTVKYEEISALPIDYMQDVYGHIGVDNDEDVTWQAVDAESFEKKTGGRKKGEYDKNSFMRSGKAGDWVNHLDEDVLQRLEDHVGEFMDRFGYERATKPAKHLSSIAV